MKAVAYRLRSGLRKRWLALGLLTVLVAVVVATVVAIAAGARRTQTVASRYTEEYGADFDATVTSQRNGRPRLAEIADLPGVEAVNSYTFVFGGLVGDDGQGLDALMFVGTPASLGSRIVEGRDANPDDPTEFVANRLFLTTNGAEVGDHFHAVTYTQEQADRNAYGRERPAGPAFDATLVGVIDGPASLENPESMSLFSPAALDIPGYGVALSAIVVGLTPGTTVDDLRDEVATLPDSDDLTTAPAELISNEMQEAFRVQARGTWLLAIVAAVAAIAVLAQVITRQLRSTETERQRLTALGFTERQVMFESVARCAVPIVVGCVLGGALAITVSDAFPTGFPRKLEPSPGTLVQWPVLITSVVAVTGLLFVWTATTLTLGNRRVASVQPTTAVEAIATHTGSAASGVGVRFAFTRASGQRGSVRAGAIGILLTLAALVAALTFGSSLGRLIDEPARYGANYDAAIGDSGGERIDPALANQLETDPDVIALAYRAGSYARAGTDTIALVGYRSLRAGAEPPVRSGRLPASDDEIALGAVTARELGAGIGDTVDLVGRTGRATLRVTGIAVVPGLGASEGIGEGAVLTMPGLAMLDSTAQVVDAGVTFRPGSNPIPRYAKYLSGGPPDPYVPAVIVNIDRVRAIPYVLAGLLAALAVLTVGHTLLTSLRARRHDIAVLRSLGADRRLVSHTVHWQATLFTLVPAVLAVPAGLILGRLIFGAYADGIGAIGTASLPLLTLTGMMIGVVLLANMVALFPAWQARRASPAGVLQSE
jgi:ABC-type lipoprotein release transport system permease subunit